MLEVVVSRIEGNSVLRSNRLADLPSPNPSSPNGENGSM